MKKIFLAFLLVAMSSCSDQPSSPPFPQSIVDRHEHIRSLDGLEVGIIIFSDHHDHPSRLDPLYELQEKIERYDHKVKCIEFLRKKDYEQLKGKIDELSKKVDAIFLIGGTGYSKNDKAIEEAAPLLDLEIEGFQQLYNYYTLEKNNYPKLIEKKNLVLSTRTAAFFMKNDTIIIFTPGSPNGAMLVVEVIADSLKHLKYQRIKKHLEDDKFLQ